MGNPDKPSFQDLQYRFAAHIRDPDHAPAPDDIEDRRMGIYRELFFNNVRNFLAGSFPVLRKLYGDAGWDALVRDFFVHHRAHTPLFPELPRELLRFIENHRGPAAGDPDWLLELAHYEWVELALSLDEADIDEVDADPTGDLLDQCPVRSPLAWLLSYRYPVHHIRPDFRPTAAPDQATHLAVYRGRDDRVRFTELNAVSARLLQMLDEHPDRTGRDHLLAITEELGSDQPEKIVEAGRGILQDFLRREIVLGAKAQ